MNDPTCTGSRGSGTATKTAAAVGIPASKRASTTVAGTTSRQVNATNAAAGSADPCRPAATTPVRADGTPNALACNGLSFKAGNTSDENPKPRPRAAEAPTRTRTRISGTNSAVDTVSASARVRRGITQPALRATMARP